MIYSFHIPGENLSRRSRDSLLLYCDEMGGVDFDGRLFVLSISPSDKKVNLGIVSNALQMLKRFGVSVKVEKKDGVPQTSFTQAIKFFSLYFIALSQSDYTGTPPSPLATMSEATAKDAKSQEDILKCYAMARFNAWVTLKATAKVDPKELIKIEDKVSDLDQFFESKAMAESKAEVAEKSHGSLSEKRLLIIQCSDYLLDQNKFEIFVNSGAIYQGFMVSPDERWDKLLIKSLKDKHKNGFVELSFFLSEGVSSDDLLLLLGKSGSLKTKLLINKEIGYLPIPISKHGIRISEWFILSSGRYQKVYDISDVRRFKAPMLHVSRKA